MANETSEGKLVRNDFLDALVSLYAPQGLKGISVNRLCQHAGYSRSTFYRYFYSLDDTLEALEDRTLPTRAMRQLESKARSISMIEFSNTFLDVLTSDDGVSRILFAHDSHNRYFDKLVQVMKPAFRAQAERVYEMSDFEYDILAEHLTASKVQLYKAWTSRLSHVSLTRLTNITDSTIERGFWDLVDQADRTQREGREFQRVKINDLVESRDWLKSRHDSDF